MVLPVKHSFVVVPTILLTNITWRDMLQSPVYQSNLVGLIVNEAHRVKMMA